MSIWIKTAMVYDKPFVVSSMKVIYEAENEKKTHIFMGVNATCFLSYAEVKNVRLTCISLEVLSLFGSHWIIWCSF